MTRNPIVTTTIQWGECSDAFYPGSNRETARRLIDEARAGGNIDLHYTDADGFTMVHRGALTELDLAISDHRAEICKILKAEYLIAEATAAGFRLSISRHYGCLAVGPCQYPPEYDRLSLLLGQTQTAIIAELRAMQERQRRPAKRKRKVQP